MINHSALLNAVQSVLSSNPLITLSEEKIIERKEGVSHEVIMEELSDNFIIQSITSTGSKRSRN